MAAPEKNQLAGEKSPYLLQHKDNPVHWLPWGEEAFALARETNRPVFLSIGYSTCHWCHVMAHESFENPEIAELMNQYFVNIKVDREERPDVDRLYMAFVQSVNGQGGWPMSVWLTPDGDPFHGGTYFPPEDRFGRPGFPRILTGVARAWMEREDEIRAHGTEIIQTLGAETSALRRGDPGKEATRRAVGGFAASYDEELGGFGGAPKFPRPSVFNFLLRYAATHPAEEEGRQALAMTLQTLRSMARGGMYDHLGGGFHRYSVDRFWHVPHFEKMLYDQGQLAVSYIEAYRLTKDDTFAQVARETLDYVLRDLRHPEGGLYSAEDADSLSESDGHHAEGAFYVWTRAEIEELLSVEEARVICHVFGVEAAGNTSEESDPQGEFRGKNVLFVQDSVAQNADALGLAKEDFENLLASGKAKLLQARGNRPRPHLDNKILAAWNGLAISAFAQAGAALDDSRYLDAARQAVDFLRKNLRKADTGELLRSWCGEPSGIAAFCEDYAFVIQGLIDLYQASGEATYLEEALALQETQDRLFADEVNGGYYSNSGQDPTVKVRMKEDYDGAEPSANSISALNLLRLARILHREEWETKARSIFQINGLLLEKHPQTVPQLLAALEMAQTAPRQAVIAGDPGSKEVKALARCIHDQFLPDLVLLYADGGEGQKLLSRYSEAIAAMTPVAGNAALYLCENFTCQAPVTSLEEVGHLLKNRA